MTTPDRAALRKLKRAVAEGEKALAHLRTRKLDDVTGIDRLVAELEHIRAAVQIRRDAGERLKAALTSAGFDPRDWAITLGTALKDWWEPCPSQTWLYTTA